MLLYVHNDGMVLVIGRNVSSRCLAPQFGMASAHSLEPFLGYSSLNFRWFYLVMLGLGVRLRSPLEGALYIECIEEY